MNRLTKTYLFPCLVLAFFGLTLFFSSCSPDYRPNVVNTPLMRNKGDVRAGIYTGTNGTDLQGAYAITPHLAAMFNATWFNGKSGSSSINGNTTNYFNRHVFAEIAPGYYTPLGSMGSFEVYSGLGRGISDNWNDNDPAKVRSNYNRFFIQPGIGITTDVVDVSLATRATIVGVKAVADPSATRDVSSLIEPAVTVRAGYKYIKLSVQTGLTLPITPVEFDVNPFMINFGVHFSYPYKKDK